MSLVLTDGGLNQVRDPAPQDVSRLLGGLRDVSIPVLTLSASSGDELEAAWTREREYVMSYKEGEQRRCSVDSRLDQGCVTSVFRLYIDADPSWKKLVVWRKFAWPLAGSDEDAILRQATHGIVAEARSKRAGQLSRAQRVFAIRKAVRPLIARGLGRGLTKGTKGIEAELRYDIEKLILEYVKDALAEPVG